MNCNILKLQEGDREIHLLSTFTKEELQCVQSRSELFFGRLIEPSAGVTPSNITYNLDFLVHMHALVRDEMCEDEEVQLQVKEQPNGFVFIVDRRSPATGALPDAKVDKEDIIGIFLCNNRTTSVDNYRPNPDYQLVSEKGVGQLPLRVEQKLINLLNT